MVPMVKAFWYGPYQSMDVCCVVSWCWFVWWTAKEPAPHPFRSRSCSALVMPLGLINERVLCCGVGSWWWTAKEPPPHPFRSRSCSALGAAVTAPVTLRKSDPRQRWTSSSRRLCAIVSPTTQVSVTVHVSVTVCLSL